MNFVERYAGRAWLERELPRVFGRSWQVALPSRGLSAMDSHARVELGAASLLVCRTQSGLAAYFNVCPHRGPSPGRCPTWPRGGPPLPLPPLHLCRPADGVCIGAPDAHAFDANPLEELRLHAVRCEEFAGMVWVNPDPEAPPLRTALGRAWEWIAPYELESWGVTQHVAVRLAANWKASADVHSEAFQPFHSLHPEVLPFVDDVGTRTELRRSARAPDGALGDPQPAAGRTRRSTRASRACGRAWAWTRRLRRPPAAPWWRPFASVTGRAHTRR